MKRKVMSALLAVVLVLSVFVPATAASADSFTDVKKDDWFYSYVDYMSTNEYMKGTSAATFSPNDMMSRSMFVTVLSRLAKAAVNNNAESTFPDVEQGTWYTGAVVWASANQLVRGYDTGVFGTNDNITRQDIAVMLMRYLDFQKITLKDNALVASFSDASDVSAYARNAVEYCRLHGLINGAPDGRFAPLQYATRAEVAAMIARMMAVIQEETTKPSGNGGGGGGGGTDTPVVTTNHYRVEARIQVPMSDKGLILSNTYKLTTTDGVVSGDQNVDSIVTALISSGENKQALVNAMNEILGKVKGKSYSATAEGETITLSIDTNGVISATTTASLTLLVPADEIAEVVNNLPGVVGTVSSDDVMTTLEALQKGEPENVHEEILTTLIDQAGKVADWKEEKVSKKIEEVIASDQYSEAVKTMLQSMSPKDVLDAAKDYEKQLQAFYDAHFQKTQRLAAVNAGSGGVVMTIDLDLTAYLEKAQSKYEAEKQRVIVEAGKKGINLNTEAFEKFYSTCAPEKLVNSVGGKLALLSGDNYYALMSDVVNKSTALRATLTEENFAAVIEKFKSVAADKGITYTLYDKMSSLLSSKGGVLAGLGSSTLFEASQNVTKDNAASILDRLFNRLGIALEGFEVPGEMLGTYEVSIKVTKTA